LKLLLKIKSIIFGEERPFSNVSYRQSMLELLFEKFNCEGLFIKSSACLSSYLFSKESSLVIDVGGHNTYVTPVNDGFQIDNKGKHYKFGGENLTFSLDSFLMEKKPELFDFSFFRRNKMKGTPLENFARLELIRDIKHSTFKVILKNIFNKRFPSMESGSKSSIQLWII
jgi:actin-related protein